MIADTQNDTLANSGFVPGSIDAPDQELLREYAATRSESAFAQLVARHANEIYIMRRIAVNPVFDLIAVFIRFSALVARFAKRQKHLIFVHPRDSPLLLNRLFDGLRQLVHVLFGRRVLFEIEDRR